jgi:hypothetical protein
LSAALQSGARADVLIVGSQEGFKAASVADKGDRWTGIFDGVLSHHRVSTIAVPGEPNDDGFRCVNEQIYTHAASSVEPGEEIVAVGVTPGRRDGVDHTEYLLDRFEAAGHLVLRLNPSRQHDDVPIAFVAMPYGVRPAVSRQHREWDADATWRRILFPVLLDAGFRPVRADLEASLEMIDVKMIRAMGRASLFVADLALHNPNVFWELGVRHAWKSSGTLLVKPEGPPHPPFDVNHVPVHEYRRSPDGVTDSDAVASIRALRAVLRSKQAGVDSPVFVALPGLRPVELPPARDPAGEGIVADFAEQLSLATALCDGEGIIRIVEQIPKAISASTADVLREQAGLALVDLGEHEGALSILMPLAESDIGFTRELLQQRYALALIHARQPAENRADRLRMAELRLQRLNDSRPGSAETLGLLGSAAKRAFLLSRNAGGDGLAHLHQAIAAYEEGFQADPTDYFPGVNAVALLRVRGQHLWLNKPRGLQDVARARQLIPVVRFALDRPQVPDSVWLRATSAEIAFHEYLIEGTDEGIETCLREYMRAAERATPFQRRSMKEQLEMFAELGDPAEVISEVLTLLER